MLGGRIKPFSWLDVCLSGALNIAVISIWYIGSFHDMHHGDSIMRSFTSLYNWTFFAWEQSRSGSLMPLLTIFVKRPYLNLFVLTFLYSLAFMATFALWGCLFAKNTTLTEHTILAIFFVPLLWDKDYIFNLASSSLGSYSVSIMLCGGFGYLIKHYEVTCLNLFWLYTIGFLVTAFLAVYVNVAIVVILFALSLQPLLISIQNKPTGAWQNKERIITPVLCVVAAYFMYKMFETNSRYYYEGYPLDIDYLFVAYPNLVYSWQRGLSDLEVFLLYFVVVISFILFRVDLKSLIKPHFFYLYFIGAMVTTFVLASSDHVAKNDYADRFLVHLSFFLIFVSTAITTQIPRVLVGFSWSKKAYTIFLTSVLLYSGYMHVSIWRPTLDIHPFDRLERTLGSHRELFVELDCDVIIGNFWKVWPVVFSVNDYYYRNNIPDPHRPNSSRIVVGIAHQTWGMEPLWRPMYNWPDVKFCAFRGDEEDVEWSRRAYIPDVVLEPYESKCSVSKNQHDINSFASTHLPFYEFAEIHKIYLPFVLSTDNCQSSVIKVFKGSLQ